MQEGAEAAAKGWGGGAATRGPLHEGIQMAEDVAPDELEELMFPEKVADRLRLEEREVFDQPIIVA